MKLYSCFLVVATILSAACAAPDTAEPIAESAPTLEEEGNGGGCTLGALCISGGINGHCAKSPSTGAAMCCTGCVDAYGYCRAGTFAGQCGNGGNACNTCETGLSCPNGTCISYCATPGEACLVGFAWGVYGNGPNNNCVCCTGCFTVDGTCVNGYDDLLCGRGGIACQNCGGLTCVSGTCQ
jgi:hypothetical protein